MKRLRRPVRRAALATVCLAASAAPALAQSTVFRLADLDLRDPHLFIELVGCRDVTDAAIAGFSFNAEIQTQMQTDSDGDGRLDLSYVLEFMPLDQALATNFVAAGRADCKPPLATAACVAIVEPFIAADATLASAGTCLAPVTDTLRPYAPAVTSTGSPCFSTSPATVQFTLAGFPIPLQETQFAATFVGTPATNLVNGLIRGFISETTANASILPANLALVGGQLLSRLLAGGTGNCAAHSDKDLHNGVPGWWFYFNYTAPKGVQELPLVFRHGFEDG